MYIKLYLQGFISSFSIHIYFGILLFYLETGHVICFFECISEIEVCYCVIVVYLFACALKGSKNFKYKYICLLQAT